MKIQELRLRGYKKFVKNKTFRFVNEEGGLNEKTLILGNNGSGKSSLLQAVVLLIATATRDGFKPTSLDWSGFEYRFSQSGRLPVKIEADVVFSDIEAETTFKLAEKLISQGVNLGLPSKKEKVTLSLDYDKEMVFSRKGSKEFYQFSGYQYAKMLASRTTNGNSFFDNVGNIYWYNEQRNSFSLSFLLKDDLPQLDYLRSFLANAYNFHLALERNDRELREGQFDFYSKFHELYQSVFPGRSFVGAAPRFDVFEQSKTPDFFLFDGKNEYELSGMSAGERAIFPILMEFARWNINNSIIIIDEVELHLHPPLQQSFIRALSKLGKNNQFILTSHSNTVASMFEEEEIIRL